MSATTKTETGAEKQERETRIERGGGREGGRERDGLTDMFVLCALLTDHCPLLVMVLMVKHRRLQLNIRAVNPAKSCSRFDAPPGAART